MRKISSALLLLVVPVLLVMLVGAGCGSKHPGSEDQTEDNAMLQGPVAQSWAAIYNGPGNGTDEAVAMAIDSAGNVYVTGRSTGASDDFATVKYNSAGAEEWVRRYDGPAGLDDEATDIVVDYCGNVLVTGSSRTEGPSNITSADSKIDYVTIKYDSSGNQLWLARYDGPAGGNDSAAAMALDSSGNVYVTGISTGSSYLSYDYATVKYEANGNQLWLARYDSPAGGNDSPVAIAVDSSGNVYVTGEGAGSPIYNDDWVTIKYDANGNQLWAARYDGPAHDSDSPVAMVLDSSGNVYVTGCSEGDNTSTDYATVKYNSEGKEMWARRYDGPSHSHDQAKAIAVDSSGSVYVTGYIIGGRNSNVNFYISTDYDCATIKYDSSGNEVWVARYDGPAHDWDEGDTIAIDNSGNIYITGMTSPQADTQDYFTAKYDSDGNRLWTASYNGAGDYDDGAIAIALDSYGSVYVTGTSSGSSTGDDYVTIRYTQQ